MKLPLAARTRIAMVFELLPCLATPRTVVTFVIAFDHNLSGRRHFATFGGHLCPLTEWNPRKHSDIFPIGLRYRAQDLRLKFLGQKAVRKSHKGLGAERSLSYTQNPKPHGSAIQFVYGEEQG